MSECGAKLGTFQLVWSALASGWSGPAMQSRTSPPQRHCHSVWAVHFCDVLRLLAGLVLRDFS
jgi:hypothetical protein